jgi:NADH:ubiquinone oxidoreductase subunit 4 (subunit M)
MALLIPFVPESAIAGMPLLLTISLISTLYSAVTTLRQLDLKKVIAYSSVVHMSLVPIISLLLAHVCLCWQVSSMTAQTVSFSSTYLV